MTNPWDLTPIECATLEALAQDSHTKTVAKKLGICPAGIEGRVKRARIKMGDCSRVQAVVFWDRYIREIGKQA